MTGPTMVARVATPTFRVPDSLAELDQWILWRNEQRDGGKPTTVPCAPGDKSGMEQERAKLLNIFLHLPQTGREART